MSLLTALPPLERLPNPHLLVVGPWRMDVLRALMARERGNAMPLCLLAGDAHEHAGSRTVDCRRLDLLEALGGSSDSIANWRTLLMPLAHAAGGAVAQTLEGLLRSHLERAPQDVPGTTAVRIRFPSGMRAHVAGAILDDMVQHAHWAGHPPPRVRSVRAGAAHHVAAFHGDARSAREALERGELGVGELVISLSVRAPEDWQPYAAAGLIPELPGASIAVAIALEGARLRQLPAYRSGDAAAIEALARHRVDLRLWSMAAEHGVAAVAPPPPPGSKAIIEALAAAPATAAFGVALRGLLAGDRRPPPWWPGELQLLAMAPSQGLRNATILEALAERAALISELGQRKVLCIDGDLLVEPAVQGSLERLLRAGRKHHAFIIVLLERFHPGLRMLADLAANWLVDAQDASMAIDRPAPSHETPLGWWCPSQSPRPAPLGCWFTSEEVVAGDRILHGADHAVSA